MVNQYYDRKKYISKDLCDKNNNMMIQNIIGEMVETSTLHFKDYKKEGFENSLWILMSWKIKINEMPIADKEYIFDTKVLGYLSFLFARNYMIKDENKVLVEASSIWTIIDSDTRRIMKVPKSTREKMNKLTREELNSYKPELDLPKNENIVKSFKVEDKDIDENGHVNNAVYIKWFLESVQKDKIYKNIEIVYIKETMPDEEIIIVIDDSSPVNKVEFKNKISLERKAIMHIS